MDIIPFDQLKPSTINLIVTLDHTINIDRLFHLIEITQVILPDHYKSSKLPYVGSPGKIISARYNHKTRGLGGGFFPHSIILSISNNQKNVVLKLSNHILQITGVDSVEMGRNTTELVLSHIRRIQQFLKVFQSNSQLTNDTFTWVEQETADGEGIKIPPEYPDRFPSTIDSDLARYLIRFSTDFLFHKDYLQKLAYVRQLDHVVDKDIAIINISFSIINYNYSISNGHNQINRWKLFIELKNDPRFIVHYDNMAVHNIQLWLPFKIPDHLVDQIKRKENKRRHVFMIYKSGTVTQSSPHPELAKEAYNQLMNIISTLDITS